MKTISAKKMKDYLLFFEALRIRCEEHERANVRTLGKFMKVSPNLFYAAVELGYFKKLSEITPFKNKSYYQCTEDKFTEAYVRSCLKRSQEKGKVWSANRHTAKSFKVEQKEEPTTTLAAPENPPQHSESLWPKDLIKHEKPSLSMPPLFPEIKAFAEMRAAKGNKRIDPLLFHAHYSATGWKIGKNPMKNWKAAFVTWERREFVNDPLSLKLCSKEVFEKEMERRGYGYRIADLRPTAKASITNYIKNGDGQTKEIIDLFPIVDLIAAIKRKGATGEIQYTATLTEKL